MIFANENGSNGILFIIIGVIVLSLVVFFLLYLFVFSRNRFKRQVKELDKRVSYLDALLLGTDTQYIHRLEVISRTNLLYVEKYNEFQRRFKTIYENDDKFVAQMIKQLHALIDNNQYKNIKTVISDTKKAIDIFDENLSQLDKELCELIKPEEESRTAVLRLKEEFRRIKQLFYANSNSLELVATSLNAVFDKIDSSFSRFESCLEGGDYEEANSIIPTVKNVLLSIDKALKDLPNLCILLTDVIPEKIRDLTNDYETVERKGVPLFNLSFHHKIHQWDILLEQARENMINLKFNNIKTTLDKVTKEVEELSNELQKELLDKDDFDLRIDELYHASINLEKKYVKICAALPRLREFYVISSDKEEALTKLNEGIDSLSRTRRTLDNFIHSSTKQPFSILKGKLDELQKDYDTVNQCIQDFEAYLDFLRSSSDDAYSLVFVYYYRTKQIESMIRDIDVPSFANQYTAKVEEIYSLLNEIDIAIKIRPINVERINEMMESLKNNGNNFFDDIENRYREQQLAESSIVYGNRDRNHINDTHKQYLILEEEFFEGKFGKVHCAANDLFRTKHAEVSSDGGK